jgi:dephospho-CoA kinase
MPVSEKVKHATYVIDNSGDLEKTREQVKRVWEMIM